MMDMTATQTLVTEAVAQALVATAAKRQRRRIEWIGPDPHVPHSRGEVGAKGLERLAVPVQLGHAPASRQERCTPGDRGTYGS